jgi:hypothetical protein
MLPLAVHIFVRLWLSQDDPEEGPGALSIFGVPPRVFQKIFNEI